jgi:hypothetical protein
MIMLIDYLVLLSCFLFRLTASTIPATSVAEMTQVQRESRQRAVRTYVRKAEAKERKRKYDRDYRLKNRLEVSARRSNWYHRVVKPRKAAERQANKAVDLRLMNQRALQQTRPTSATPQHFQASTSIFAPTDVAQSPARHSVASEQSERAPLGFISEKLENAKSSVQPHEPPELLNLFW